MAIFMYSSKREYSFNSFFENAVSLFFVFAIVFTIFSFVLSRSEKGVIYRDYKANVPLVWKEESKEQLVSLDTEGKQDIEHSGSFFLYQVSSSNSIDYQYVVKTDYGYQMRSLSDEWSFSKDEIFLKENDDSTPSLILEVYGYEDERFESVFTSSSFFDLVLSTKERRCTFVVPTGTVKTHFKFN